MMKQKSKTLESLTATAYHNTGLVIASIGILYFILFSVLKVVPQSKILVYIIPIVLVLLGIICVLSSKFSKLRKASSYLTAIAIFTLSCDPHVSIKISLAIPVLLSLYHLDRGHSLKVLLATTILFIISIIIRYILLQDFLATEFILGRVGIIRGSIASSIAFLCEVTLMVTLYAPYHLYIMIIGNERSNLLNEKNNAIEDVVIFCNTAMTYHSKYLLIHNKSVEAITRVILSDLKKDIKYSRLLSPQHCADILASVQFHDIGKIYIGPNILDKPGKLTKEEYNIIKEHPVRGVDLFSTLPLNVTTTEFRRTCGKIILEHHERLNGSGYPLGTTNISFEGQLVAVADVTDALLSWRCYKSPFSWDRFVDTLTSDTGLNQEFCNIVIKHKDEIINIIDRNNIKLKELFQLSQNDILCH